MLFVIEGFAMYVNLMVRCLFLIGAAAVCSGCGDGTPTPPPPALTNEPTADPAPPVDLVDATKQYATVLAEIVDDAGLVRYELLAEPARMTALETMVSALAESPLPEDRYERLALWCNAYNANVLLMALTYSGKEGFVNVLKVDGFFDKQSITVAGEKMTLNGLENDRIRPLGDPRIHAALVCAAMSCPPLRDEPYDAAKIEAQLDDQCRRWVNDSAKFRMVDGKLGLSEILNWYGEDFDIPRYGNRIGFVLAYAEPGSDITKYIVGADKPETVWLTYDWTLNRAPADAGNGGEQRPD
jgi:hypothetical protein